ncbi:MAG: HupE/UreJ family protein [Geminicoccaceae bacterium]|nr:HupE/UreJ family protein [Geminicoccaceae bacterium]
MSRSSCLVMLLFSLLRPVMAHAHDPGMTAATLLLEPARATLELSVKGRDLEQESGVRLRYDGEGNVDPAALAEQAGAVRGYIGERAGLAASGRACRPAQVEIEAIEDNVVSIIDFPCGRDDAGLTYATRLLHDIQPATVQTLLVVDGDQSSTFVLDRAHPRLNLNEQPSPAGLVWRFFLAGTTHLFIGFDHIAFLLALILWARRIAPLVKVVTAFTIAHSITLSLAAFSIFVLPSRWVEALIAATVVGVAAENFRSRDAANRWIEAFVLGLFHGFGFASVLADLAIEKDVLVPALFGFNLGVEAGQLVIVAVAVPLLRGVDHLTTPAGHEPRRAPVVVWFLSALIAAFGCYWLVERLFMTP